jgi:hypothetical protein
VNRLYVDYLPIAIWVSVFLCLALNEVIKRQWMYYHAFILSIWGTFMLFSFNYTQILLGMYAAGISLLVLFGYVVYKKWFTHAPLLRYEKLFSAFPFYYLGICTFIGCYQFIQRDWISLWIAPGILYITLSLLHPCILPMRHHHQLSFRIGWSLWIIAVLVAILGADQWKLGAFLIALATIIVNIAVYKRNIYPHTWGSRLWGFDMVALHITNALAYTALIWLVFDGWNGVLVTILLVLHAIILLFNSARKAYAQLAYLSALLFATAIAKLYFVDMQGFEIVQKIIVFMVIGALMLGSAFLFVKFRDYVDKQP